MVEEALVLVVLVMGYLSVTWLRVCVLNKGRG